MAVADVADVAAVVAVEVAVAAQCAGAVVAVVAVGAAPAGDTAASAEIDPAVVDALDSLPGSQTHRQRTAACQTESSAY